MIQNAIFDLDGTLLNTIDDIAASANWVCERNGWPTFSVEEYKYMVGHGIPSLVHNFTPEALRDDDTLAGARAQFSARYAAHREDATAPFDGIMDMLRTLRANGVKCSVFSNKADGLCQMLMRDYFADAIHLVRGQLGDTPLKPDPTGMLALMERGNMNPETTVFIGDSDVDMETAKNAGVASVAVLWGFRKKEELLAAGATIFAETPAELATLLTAK